MPLGLVSMRWSDLETAEGSPDQDRGLVEQFTGEGWSIAAHNEINIELLFADLDDPENQRRVPSAATAETVRDIPELDALDPLPVAARAPTRRGMWSLRRGREQLDLRVTDVDDGGLLRRWADELMTRGAAEPCPAGRGFAGGPGVAIDMGVRLVEMLYSAGTPFDGPGGRASRERHEQFANELLQSTRDY